MVDYSAWDKGVEVSDDEDDTHPNIDTPSLYRWRHDARLQRMQEMEEERKEIQEKKKVLQQMKIILEKGKAIGDNDFLIEREKEYKQMARELTEQEKALTKKEKLCPWNVDTIAQDGFSKTVINEAPKQNGNAELSDEEKGKRLQTFIKENSDLLKKFGMLRKFEDSKRFLQEHPQLVCEDTSNYLVLWCIELAMEEKFGLMEHVSHQCISMQFLLELAKQLDRDPKACAPSFFSKIAHAEQSEYQQAFEKELESFRRRIRQRAEQRIKEGMKEAEKERKDRVGPGGLDPIEVLQSLPEALRNCFEEQDIEMLQRVIAEMPVEEAERHMKRCAESGLWCPAGKEEVEPQKEETAEDTETEFKEENASVVRNYCAIL